MKYKIGPKTGVAITTAAGIIAWTWALIATLALIEQAFCREHFAEADSQTRRDGGGDPSTPVQDPEMRCKIPEVQAPTAWLNGTLPFVLTFPGMLVGGAFNRVAEKIGRRNLLYIVCAANVAQSITQFFIAYFDNIFSIWWLYSAAILSFIGGGDTVQWGLYYAFFLELAPEGSRLAFMCYVSAYLAGVRTISSLLAARMLARSVWLLVWFDMLAWVAVLATTAFVPDRIAPPTAATEYELVETEEDDSLLDDEDLSDLASLNGAPNGHRSDALSIPANGNGNPNSPHPNRRDFTFPPAKGQIALSPDPQEHPPHSSSPLSSPVSLVRVIAAELYASIALVVNAFRIPGPQRTLLLVYFFTVVGGTAEYLFVQYMSQAFSWPLSFANTIASLQFGGGCLAILVLPTIVRLASRRSGAAEDRAILRVNQFMLLVAAVGAAGMGLGFGWQGFLLALAVYTAGYRSFDTVKAFAATFEQESEGKGAADLGFLLMTVENVAVLFSGPGMNGVFALSLKHAWLPESSVFWLYGVCLLGAWWLTRSL